MVACGSLIFMMMIYVSNVMIITNALMAWCEVELNRKSTHGPGGPIHSVISWEPITMKDKFIQVTPYGLGKNSISKPMPAVLFLYTVTGSPRLEVFSPGGRQLIEKVRRRGDIILRSCTTLNSLSIGLALIDHLIRRIIKQSITVVANPTTT